METNPPTPEELAAIHALAAKATAILSAIRAGSHHSDIRFAGKVLDGNYDQDFVTALLDAPAALIRYIDTREAGAWRPIETAPNIDAARTRVWIIGGRYQEPELVVCDGEHWRWCIQDGLKKMATHWCPCNIPSPPKDTQ